MKDESATAKLLSLHPSAFILSLHPSAFILHPSISEPLACLRRLGALRVAAHQLAPRRAVVVKLSLRGVEDELHAAAVIAVESAEVEEVACDGSAAGLHLARVEAAAGLARELRGGLFRRVAKDEQHRGSQRRARERVEEDSRAREAVELFGCANESQQARVVARARGPDDRVRLNPADSAARHGDAVERQACPHARGPRSE